MTIDIVSYQEHCLYYNKKLDTPKDKQLPALTTIPIDGITTVAWTFEHITTQLELWNQYKNHPLLVHTFILVDHSEHRQYDDFITWLYKQKVENLHERITEFPIAFNGNYPNQGPKLRLVMIRGTVKC